MSANGATKAMLKRVIAERDAEIVKLRAALYRVADDDYLGGTSFGAIAREALGILPDAATQEGRP